MEHMIGVDWGTTSFRAFRLAPDGTIRDRRSSARGIMNVPSGHFGDTLREEIGPWLAAGETRVLLSGMIGSRQGWKEAPYLPCPAGAADLAANLVDIGFDWAQVKLVPGLSGTDEAGVAEVMRGEETQIVGLPASARNAGLVCLPGTHAKWAEMRDGRIVTFTTHMTGEIYAAVRNHTILGRMMADDPPDIQPGDPAFQAGLMRSADPGGLLHHLFGVRAQTLFGRLTEHEAPAYLSGLLIGHEVRAALASTPVASAPLASTPLASALLAAAPLGNVVQVVGAPDLSALYTQAITACGGVAERHDADAAGRGLWQIAAHTSWAHES